LCRSFTGAGRGHRQPADRGRGLAEGTARRRCCRGAHAEQLETGRREGAERPGRRALVRGPTTSREGKRPRRRCAARRRAARAARHRDQQPPVAPAPRPFVATSSGYLTALVSTSKSSRRFVLSKGAVPAHARGQGGGIDRHNISSAIGRLRDRRLRSGLQAPRRPRWSHMTRLMAADLSAQDQRQNGKSRVRG